MNKILKLLNFKYFRQNMFKDVKKYVNICDVCQRIKTLKHCFYGAMQAFSQFEKS